MMIAMLLILIAGAWLLAIAAILAVWAHLVTPNATPAPHVPMSDEVIEHAWLAQQAQPFNWEVE